MRFCSGSSISLILSMVLQTLRSWVRLRDDDSAKAAVGITMASKTSTEPRVTPSTEFEVEQVGPPRFQRVYWMREAHLRKLYGLTVILMLASATTGYDGILLNISQHIRAWNYFFFPELRDNPDLEDPVLDSKLAIMVNMFNIGSVLSFFITPFIADNYGRRTAIFIGCTIMMAGGFLTAFCNGYASEFCRRLCGDGDADRLAYQCTWAAASCSALATPFHKCPPLSS